MTRPRKLRILFDAHPLLGSKTGVGYYTAGLIEALAEYHADEVELVGYYHNFLLRKHVRGLPTAPNIRYRQVFLVPGQIVNALRRLHIPLPIELLAFTRADFILYPNFLGHSSLFRTPSATVIHDLAYLDARASVSEKNARDLTRFVPVQIKRSRFLITVSNFTRQRLVEQYKVAPEDILVTFIPPVTGEILNESRVASINRGLGITKSFILFVGTLEPRKNVLSLLEAYAQLSSTTLQKYSLVLAGKVDWKFEQITQKIRELKDKGLDIHYLGYISEEARASLYQAASLCVFPAYYEGFGMPVLEALSRGTPCVISDIPTFHEVGGDVVRYFDPYDVDNIREAIEEELHQPSHTHRELQDYVSTKPNWKDIANLAMQEIQSELSSH